MTRTHTPEVEQCGLRERKKRRTRAAIHTAALELVTDQGLEATTIEEISEAADISARTFFNYYPSKAAAALGIIVDPLTEADNNRFLASTGDLTHDLCDLVAGHINVQSDVTQVKHLAAIEPEMVDDLGRQMGSIRQRLTRLAAQRTGDQHTADLAVALVVAAFTLTIHSPNTGTTFSSSAQLQHTIQELGTLARQTTTSQQPLQPATP